MPMEAMIRAPKDTPTATSIFIPSVECVDALVSVDDSEDIDGLADGDTVSVTVSVHASVSFVDFVAVTVTMLCELALIALDR